MTAAAGASFGLIGALAAFPRRLVAREVARQGGQIHRGVTRLTSHVVFGRTLLGKRDAEIEARHAAVRAAGRQTLGENGFLRLLGLAPASRDAALGRQQLIDQARLPAAALDLLSLFDAFECDAEPYSFRDLILARKYAALLAGGAPWGAIARSVHRCGARGLTARALTADGTRGIYAVCEQGLSELDGQLLLDLGPPEEAELDARFAAAETAEAEGRYGEAAALYRRCLALDPRDAVAAFNRANCLRADGRQLEAAHDYARAIKLDPGFVEAWFNLGGLMAERRRREAARRHLAKAIALDPGYADAVYNLATLEYEAGSLCEARRWWERYLELDPHSEWGRIAARGVRFAALSAAQGGNG